MRLGEQRLEEAQGLGVGVDLCGCRRGARLGVVCIFEQRIPVRPPIVLC